MKRARLWPAVLLLAVLIMPGCAAMDRDYLKVRRNFEVEKLFRQGIMLPEYNYFYYGPESEPRALLALDKKYRLNSEFWHPCEEHDRRFSYWIEEFNRLWGQLDDVAWVQIDYEGLDLHLDTGELVGMAYSRFYWIVAWRGEGNELIIPPPQPGDSQQTPGMRQGFFRD